MTVITEDRHFHPTLNLAEKNKTERYVIIPTERPNEYRVHRVIKTPLKANFMCPADPSAVACRPLNILVVKENDRVFVLDAENKATRVNPSEYLDQATRKKMVYRRVSRSNLSDLALNIAKVSMVCRDMRQVATSDLVLRKIVLFMTKPSLKGSVWERDDAGKVTATESDAEMNNAESEEFMRTFSTGPTA